MARPLHRDVIETISTRVVALLAMLAAELCISRMLQPAGRGSYALFLSSFGVLEAVFSLGFISSIIRMVSRRIYPISSIASWVTVFGLIQGLAGGLCFYWIAVVLQPSFLNGLHEKSYLWMFVALPSFLIAQNLSCVVLGQQKSILTNLSFFLQRILFGSLVLLSFVLDINSLNWVVGLYSFSMMAGAVACIAYTGRTIGFSLAFSQMVPAFIELYKYGFSIQLGTMLARLAFWSDSFFVNGFLGKEQLGYYAVARAATDIVLQFPSAVGLMLLPRVSRDPDKRDPFTTARVSRILLICQMTLGLCAIAGSSAVIYFILPRFMPAIPLLFILWPGVLGFSIFQVLIQDFIARGMGYYQLALNAFLFVIVFCLLYLFVPTWKLFGAGVGISSSRILLGCVTVFFYGRRNNVPLMRLFVIEYADVRELMERLRKRVWNES